MQQCQRITGLVLLSWLVCAPQIRAGDCGNCRAACCPAPAACAAQCGPAYRTVRVPQWTTETRTVVCTEYRSEPRQRTISVCRQVWEPQEQAYLERALDPASSPSYGVAGDTR